MRPTLLLLAGAAAAQLHEQEPIFENAGYQMASQILGETSNDPIVHEAWQILAQDPARFKQILDPYSGFGGKPAAYKRRTDWDMHVQSEQLPNYELRLKNPAQLGVDKVKQFSGYLDVLDEDKHFFFWMFESRNDPQNDPVVLWLNGGPGCASSTGEFFELGPSNIQSDLSVEYNKYAWNSNATVIFLDQPVNVGFSYSGDRVSTSTAAGEDVYAFLSLFFDALPEYNHQDFHISGESYAGHYIPAIGKAIVDHAHDRNFNLTSLLIGNGITDVLHQHEASIAMQCGKGGYPAFLSEEKCDELYDEVPRCEFLIQSCYDTDSRLVCLGALAYCSRPMQAFSETGRNPYDVREVCGDECYPEIEWIEQYMNQTSVKDALGAEPIAYVGCNNRVGTDFLLQADETVNFAPAVVDILEAGVPILIYAGDKDWICNWLGNREWTDKLQWSHGEEFADAPVLPWKIGKKQVGTTKNAGGFTFLRIFDAGHMVPYNQPKNALEMLNHWISGELSFSD